MLMALMGTVMSGLPGCTQVTFVANVQMPTKKRVGVTTMSGTGAGTGTATGVGGRLMMTFGTTGAGATTTGAGGGSSTSTCAMQSSSVMPAFLEDLTDTIILQAASFEPSKP